jgi:hypothetical protein
MAGKIPTLRPGLSVSDLIDGSWMVAETRYTATDELVELNDALLRAAAQGLIDHANGGGRVTRRTVINTLCGLAQMLTFAKDHITEKMSRGELTPSILDKLAGI